MKKQDNLRQQVRLAKALNTDWNFKTMSEVLQMNKYAFYNWLNGAYQLSQQKEKNLRSLLSDLL